MNLNPLFLSLLITSAVTFVDSFSPSSTYYHYTIDHHLNPYSSSKQRQHDQQQQEIITANNTFILRKKIRKSPNQQTHLKEWMPVNNTINLKHDVMINYGKKPLEFNNETMLLATGSNLQPISLTNDRQTLMSQQYPNQENIDFQQLPLPYFQCDSIIYDHRFIIESPNYPAQYPVNRICSYYIGKNRSDVCQIEVTISDMDIEDTPQCTADYLDLGSNRQQERLCGLMLRNTRRIIYFSSNASHIRITFHSDSKNDRPYRGFSAEVQQIPNSCTFINHTFSPGQQYPTGSNQWQQYPIDVGNVLRPGQYPSSAGQYPISSVSPEQYPVGPGISGQKYPIGFDGKINTGYGQRLYPPRYPPFFQRPDKNTGSSSDGKTGVIYDDLPKPGIYGNDGTKMVPYRPKNISTPIYLASYCDIYLGEFNGEIRSPGYPFGYPTNHSCIYTIKKANDDVCQLELIFHHFDIQTPNTQKDLTENCQGDFLQMPDGNRLCGYYTQSMSGDYKLKKYYAFPETSEYVFMHFFSDGQQTPDGSGFWIEVKQLPNTCSTNFNYKNVKCDRIISGQYSTVERIYSPNFPQFYGPRQQCVYFIQPADSKTCEFELDLVQFSLERATKQDNDECRKDFLQLPDRQRICGHHKFRKIFQFPQYHDHISMFYFHSDDQIEDRGFEIIVRQLTNSCNNYNRSNKRPWNTNVYVPNDPNIGYIPPTPVFTYDNNSGLQPYQPPLRPGPYPPIKIPTGNFANKSPFVPSSYWNSELPNILNDPRNVDSSGTIPLYFANGTLATRIPPMKPVDMIPFLKKGKTVIQKGSSGRLFPTISTPNDINAILSNRFPNSESEFFQSSSLFKKDDTALERMRSLDQMPSDSMIVTPSYNCDQTITRPVEYIRSPNFPSNYPIVTRCIYSIFKSDNSVCQIRLHLLSLDLEYTSGCKNDYLQIESTGERLCGRISQPEVRVLNHYGYSRYMQLIFNSDRQTTSSGFEVRIEQIPNSCVDMRPNTTLNAMISSGSSGPNFPEEIRVKKAPETIVPLERLRIDSSLALSAQALTNESQTSLIGGNQICRTTSAMDSYLESDNFPLEYPSNINCLYKVFRANRNVCRLEIEFEEFNVGDENNFGTTQFDPKQRPIGECLNDFLEIDGIRYCGQRSGQKIAMNFPKIFNEITWRFHTLNTASSRFNGFRIKIRQIDENCRSYIEGEIEEEFSPAIIESCPKLSSNTNTTSMIGFGPLLITETSKMDTSFTISEEVVKIQSPQFGLPSSLQYEPFLDCHYVIQKTNRNVCAMEIKFEAFALEESRSCLKDFLEINQMLRLCGKLPTNTIRVFDFFGEQMLIHFHTDSDLNEKGFAMILKQIRC